MDSMNHNQPFVSLPVELLEEISVLSETLALSHVCQRFYISLSSRPTRLRFCTRLFYFDNPRRALYLRADYLRGKQTEILAQEWFTQDFAISLRKAVKHIRASDMTRKTKIFGSGVYLPSRLFCGPWSQSKSILLRQLDTWELELNPSDELRHHESMKGTIAEGNWEALKMLLLIGPNINLKDFKYLVLSGRGSIVWKLLDWVGTGPPSCWWDAEVPEWAKNLGKDELETRGSY